MSIQQIKPSVYRGDINVVQQDGTVKLLLDSGDVRFVSQTSELSPYLSGGRTNALLVRVTNIPLSNLKSGIFIPTQPTSDAR